MKNYNLKLIEKIKEASGTWSYRFERPQDFEYVAGQHSVIKMGIAGEKIVECVRTFTFSSSPSEKKYVQVTMREGESSYKKCLQSLEIGKEVEVFPPSGKYVLPEDISVPIVMIAGGIGIVPFRSMLLESGIKNQELGIILLYSNSNVERITFKDELDSLQKSNSNFDVVYTLTEDVPEEWEGEHGRITTSMVRKYVKDLSKPMCYVCGPPEMVRSVKSILSEELGIEENRIKCEEFSGY